MAEKKLLSREEATRRVAAARSLGQRVGYTSGVFDLLHAGHVDYLERARAVCDLLVVGVNSDSSVRSLKGESRPIQAEQDRARIIAALASVDIVFIFSETNNRENIEALRPEVYIKAGDYTEGTLSSAERVRELGGRVEIMPFAKGRSTSDIITRILALHDETALPEAAPPPERRPAVFFDRDGVINQAIDYLHEPEKFELIPGIFEAMKRLEDAGFRLVVVTNQAGIGLGYFSKEDFYAVNRVMLRAAKAAQVTLDRVYFCPHGEGDGCSCRKPLPGMLLRAARERNIELARSWMVGDSLVDVQAGKAAGCRTIVLTSGQETRSFQVVPEFTCNTPAEAAAIILSNS